FIYSYVPTGNGKNQLLNIKKNGIIDQEFTYDIWHRPISANQRIDGIGYTTSLEYNTYNDVTKIIYPQSFAVDYQYNADGFLQKILRGGTSTIIYQTNTANKLGQITNYKLGNNPTSSITYQANGMPQRYLTTGIQDLNMVFNTNNGNLTSRTDAINNQTEAFTYEAAIDRLSSISTNGGSPLLIEYLNNGNINKKYDAGDYGYDANKINAVTNVTQLCSGTPQQLITPQTITYTHFNKPISIKQNFPTNTPRYELTFDYNSDHDRIKTILKTNGSSTPTATRYFVGNYEKELKAGITRHIYYIQAPTGLACIAVKQGTNAPQYYYTYTDHLGSIVAITNGSTLWKQSFDAFGRQRNPANWNDYTTIPSITLNGFVLDRGYTGHQHLKEFGIINMNGRLYDPIVGRMLNVDNFVQDPSSSQAFNRYSYVVNNPLKYTDPSGWNREDRADRKQEREYRRWERHTSIYIGSEIDDNGDDTEINYIWLYDRGGIGGEGRGNYNHSTDGYNHGTNNSVSGGVSNYTQALRPITLIVGRNPIGKALTWSYPYDNGKIYEIPTYQLTVSGSTPSGTKVIKNFEVIRFGVNGDSKGNLSMVGLADYQTYIIKKWISDYKVHSAPSKEDGAWQITGNYLIHDGPDKPMSEFYATAGCIEICGGPQGFVMFNSYLLNLSGALTKEQLANSGLLKIIYLQAARPAIKTH
nr:hypothetical protein [Bacteroidia bacterium]